MSKVLYIDDIVHPSVGSAVSLKPLIDSYIVRYNQLINNNINTIKLYCIKEKDDYIIHVMVPSEKNNEFEKPVYYDVVIQFYPVKNENKEDLTIRNYGVKLFSNSINWMFNFTYVFAKSNNIPSFIPKGYYSKQALKEPPKKTNPYGIFGIERVVFFAFYHLEMITGFRKNRLNLIELYKVTTNDLVKKLMSQEEKLDQLNLEQKKLSLQKQATKNKKIKNPRDINIINRKNNDTNKIINTLDKNFESGLKSDFKMNLKNKSLRSDMISKNGMKNINTKTNTLKKKL